MFSSRRLHFIHHLSQHTSVNRVHHSRMSIHSLMNSCFVVVVSFSLLLCFVFYYCFIGYPSVRMFCASNKQCFFLCLLFFLHVATVWGKPCNKISHDEKSAISTTSRHFRTKNLELQRSFYPIHTLSIWSGS